MARVSARRPSANRPTQPSMAVANLAVASMAVVDELHRIDRLLRMVPDLASAAALADRAPSAYPDDLAEKVRGLGLSLGADDDAGIDAPDLADLPHAATTVIETARWRLLRVAEAVRLTALGRK